MQYFDRITVFCPQAPNFGSPQWGAGTGKQLSMALSELAETLRRKRSHGNLYS